MSLNKTRVKRLCDDSETKCALLPVAVGRDRLFGGPGRDSKRP
jgi:hypothetical protein